MRCGKILPSLAKTTARNFEMADHFFSFKRGEFLTHYHRRSNVQSTILMIKANFRDHVRSKTDIAMKNEVLCEVA